VFDNLGNTAQGWPQEVVGSTYSPITGDIDSDKEYEVLLLKDNGTHTTIVPYDFNGNPASVKPFLIPRSLTNLLLLDVDNDNKVELLATSPDGNRNDQFPFQPTLYSWDTEGTQRSEYTSIWPMYLKSPTRNSLDPLSYGSTIETVSCKSAVGKIQVSMPEGWKCTVVDAENDLSFSINITHQDLPREITLSNFGRGPFCEENCDRTLFFDTARTSSYITKDGQRGEVSFGFKDITLFGENGVVWAAITFENMAELDSITSHKADLMQLFDSVENIVYSH
jgi:hypothetical protein